MGRFAVGVVEGRFVIDGLGAGGSEATAFLLWLAAHGRGSYTQRAYALGLAHFLSWLDRHDIELAAVNRPVIAEYIVAFRSGTEDGLALGRQPRTVNHRLCVLA